MPGMPGRAIHLEAAEQEVSLVQEASDQTEITCLPGSNREGQESLVNGIGKVYGKIVFARVPRRASLNTHCTANQPLTTTW